MIDAILQFSILRRYLVIFVVAMISAFGIWNLPDHYHVMRYRK